MPSNADDMYEPNMPDMPASPPALVRQRGFIIPKPARAGHHVNHPAMLRFARFARIA